MSAAVGVAEKHTKNTFSEVIIMSKTANTTKMCWLF